MTTRIAIVAPGNMGAGLAGRFVERGLEVRTSLAGRSAASVARAEAAGMTAVEEAALVEVDLLLSVVPPNEALPLAERLAPRLAASDARPLYVDCNAVSPETALRVAAVVEKTGCRFVDGSIIGMPPAPGDGGPALYVSGPAASGVSALAAYGLDVRVLDAPLGAASALKMCYGAITKGLTALGSAMILAAGRHGVAEAFREELALSQPQLLARFARSIPDMVPKAYRWVPEMQEIAGFLGEGQGEERGEAAAYDGIAQLYARLAAPEGREEIEALTAFLAEER